MKDTVSLINSDCLTALKKLSSQSIDLILTDPPYNLGLFMQNRDTNLKKMRDNFFGAADWDNLDYESWKASLEIFFEQSARVIKHGGSMIVFMAIIKGESVIAIAEKYGFYYKTTGTFNNDLGVSRLSAGRAFSCAENYAYFALTDR